MKKKKIIINSDKDYDKFLKKIIFYKSRFYYNTVFVVENNIHEEMIDYITVALNLKNRKKRIEYVYNQSCRLLDEKNKGVNICGFQNGQCYIQRKLKNGKCNGCCRMCIYQTKNGCPTKNFACKLFHCSEVKTRYEVMEYKDLKLLKVYSFKNRLIVKSDYFSKKEDVLKDLYSYSLIYSTVRIVYRLIRNFIKFNRTTKESKEKGYCYH